MKKILKDIFALFFQPTSEKRQENYKYIYIGESEHWKAKFLYTVSETLDEKKNYSNEAQYSLTFSYKGTESEVATLKNISYGFDTLSGSDSNTEQFTETEPNTKSVFKLSGASQNAATILPDHVITATIQWDDFEETIVLNIEE